MTFGEKIKKLRIENNLKQDFVAKSLHISVAALSRYESDMFEPKSISIIADFAKLYNVSTDYLLNVNNKNTNDDESILTKEELKNLTKEQIRDIKQYIEFIKQKKDNKKF